ncbi:MAG: hypothetical protein ACI80S_000373 [Pseudohongiellaceae bacterium]|jgi:hypothetical protein
MPSMKYALLSLAFCPLLAISADKHVHGEAELFIALEGSQILVELESPADNIIGFEHAPATPTQHQQLASSLALLEQHSTIITFEQVACQQISAAVTSPFKNHVKPHDSTHEKHTHETHGEHEAHEKDHDSAHEDDGSEKNEHTEFHSSYTLQCDSDTQNISEITVNAFKHFSGINNLTVKWVSANGQGSTKATATKTKLTLE